MLLLIPEKLPPAHSPIPKIPGLPLPIAQAVAVAATEAGEEAAHQRRKIHYENLQINRRFKILFLKTSFFSELLDHRTFVTIKKYFCLNKLEYFNVTVIHTGYFKEMMKRYLEKILFVIVVLLFAFGIP